MVDFVLTTRRTSQPLTRVSEPLWDQVIIEMMSSHQRWIQLQSSNIFVHNLSAILYSCSAKRYETKYMKIKFSNTDIKYLLAGLWENLEIVTPKKQNKLKQTKKKTMKEILISVYGRKTEIYICRSFHIHNLYITHGRIGTYA